MTLGSFAQGRDREARAILEEVLRRDPSNEDARKMLGGD